MKHEQIILVALGYIIGFVTAYIGFAMSSNATPRMHEERRDHSNGLVKNAEASQTIERSEVNNDGLFVLIGGKERVVSAGALVEEQGKAGFHYAIPESLVSEDGRYLYYCMQALPEHTTCDSYIYSAGTDSVYPVKDTNTSTYLSSEIVTLEVSWEEGKLRVNELVSTSAEKPWMLE